MQGAPKEFYGFDISLAEYICTSLRFQCEYIPMDFSAFIPAVESGAVDIAIGAITITLEQSKVVRFSIPYLVSEGQFIGSKKVKDFDQTKLNNKKIGVMKGNIYARELRMMGFDNLRIVEYKLYDDLIEAIDLGIIDIALIDAPTARYWKNNSAGNIQILGHPFQVGFGLGIITNMTNGHLIQDINAALLDYQNSNLFKENYDIYLNNF